MQPGSEDGHGVLQGPWGQSPMRSSRVQGVRSMYPSHTQSNTQTSPVPGHYILWQLLCFFAFSPLCRPHSLHSSDFVRSHLDVGFLPCFCLPPGLLTVQGGGWAPQARGKL